jgi:hypothetical protein
MRRWTALHPRLAVALTALRRVIKEETAVIAAILLIVAGLWTFIEIVDEIEENETEEVDVWVANVLRSGDDPRTPIGPRWLITAALDATALGSFTVLTIISALVAGFLAMQQQYRSMWLVIIASALGQALSSALKSIFDRERPDEALHLFLDQRLSAILDVSFSSVRSVEGSLEAALAADALTIKEFRERCQQQLVEYGHARENMEFNIALAPLLLFDGSKANRREYLKLMHEFDATRVRLRMTRADTDALFGDPSNQSRTAMQQIITYGREVDLGSFPAPLVLIASRMAWQCGCRLTTVRPRWSGIQKTRSVEPASAS